MSSTHEKSRRLSTRLFPVVDKSETSCNKVDKANRLVTQVVPTSLHCLHARVVNKLVATWSKQPMVSVSKSRRNNL